MTIQWYFDVISPFAYLQWVELNRLSEPLVITPCPVLFAGILQHHGQRGPAEIDSKRTFTYRYVTWLAREKRIPFRFPAGHPFNPLPLLRLAIAAGSGTRAVQAVFDFVWRDGRLPEDAAGMTDLARSLGIDDWQAASADAAVKEQLKRNTQAAIDHGVFGVPTLRVDEHLFWGQDSTAMFLDYLARPDLFAEAEMQRLTQLPVAAARKV